MKIVKSLFLTLLLTFAFIGYTNLISANSDDVRKELEAVYAQIDKAVKSRDINTLESLLAEDYEQQRGSKTISRAEIIAQMKRNFEIVKEVEVSKTTIDKIQHVEGNEIVDFTQTFKATITGEDGKPQSIEGSSKGRDWWVKNEDGQWICVGAERNE